MGFVIPITESSKHKVGDKGFGIFITAQNKFVGRTGLEINIHYVRMANSFLLTGLWEWKIMGKVRGNHNLCGNFPSNKNKKKMKSGSKRYIECGKVIKNFIVRLCLGCTIILLKDRSGLTWNFY